ncbi:hypothetical protein ACFV6F_36490 [Kitasatospora phosalacinea]|uniref:hypothetical protein n=1 Tax=Kitasatospora phosalacinea TaxID=2065 RepID=UPI0036636752
MKPRGDFSRGFGLTGLTKYIRPGYIPHNAEAILAFLTETLLANDKKEYASEVVDDALRLTRSALPDEVLSVLWLAATRGYFDPQDDGFGIRAWLERIAEACLPLTGQDRAIEPSAGDEDLRPDLQPAVLAELDTVADTLSKEAVTAFGAPPLPTLVPALEAAVPVLGADLAFRLFLRAIKAYFVPISPTQLAHIEEIGERLGYHEYVVHDDGLNT